MEKQSVTLCQGDIINRKKDLPLCILVYYCMSIYSDSLISWFRPDYDP